MNAKNTRKTAQRVLADLSKIAISAPVPANPNRSNSRNPQGRQRLRGRGGYYSDAGRAGGAHLGAQLGSSAGSFLGSKAGSVVDSLIGRGDYSVKKNSIMSHSQGVPVFANSGRDRNDHSIVLEHREFVCDVVATGSTSFSIQQTYPIQPALSSTFAYASQLASAFEEWEPEGIVWCFESTSGSISTTQGLGTVLIATQYDSADPVFASQVEMLDYQFSSSACPDTSFLHPVECDPRSNASTPRLFCRTGAYKGDINLFDLGKTSIGIVGVPAAAGVVLGKLWCTYKIKLLKPKLFASLLGNSIGYASWTTANSVSVTNAFGLATGTPNGDNQIYLPNGVGSLWTPGDTPGALPLLMGNCSYTNSIYFGYPNMPIGTYRIIITHFGSVAPGLNINWVTTMNALTCGNCRRSTVKRFVDGTYDYWGNGGTSQISTMLALDIEVGPYNIVGNRCPYLQWAPFFQANTAPTGSTYVTISIQQLPNVATFKS